MTLRQLWVRIKALPADCPLWVMFERDREENEATSAIDEAMSLFPGRG